jgi:all-trans-retinol dehydrogenase (NAD+)
MSILLAAAVILLLLILIPVIAILIYNYYYYHILYPKRDIRGQTILITGGASGFGRRQADLYAKLGAKLIIWDINETLLEKAKQELSPITSVRIAKVDVSDREAVDAAAVEAGPIDILVNNAGIMNGQYVLDLTDAQIERVTAINQLAHFWTIRAFLPGMIARNSGQIVALCSFGGVAGCPRLADYAATKFAVAGLMESLTLELREKKVNVRTTTVFPFWARTGLYDMDKTPVVREGLPTLSAEFVAKETVEGVVRGEPAVWIPTILRVFVGSRIFPYQVPLRIVEGTMFGFLTDILRWQAR